MSQQTGALWEAISPPGPGYAALQADRTAELAIIGGGFLGLSTALHAAQAGLDTVLLEAETIGFGASGRNTGFVVPSLKSALGPRETAALLGAKHADRLLRLVSTSGEKVFGLIKAHGIDCAARQTGWLQPAHCATAERMLRDRLPDLQAVGQAAGQAAGQAVGQNSVFLTRAAMLERTGLPGLHGGLLVASGGQINPLAYARGLARAATTAGAMLHEQCRVRAITREGAAWRIETPGASLVAKHVLLTTNALVGAVCPPMRESIIPVQVFQIATQPLGAALRQRLLPTQSPVADTRRHTFALRWSPDHRLMTGGMVLPLPGRRERARRGFLARMARHIPDCPSLTADFIWNGMIAATLDSLPRIVRIEPGLMGAIGCNGRGVALTTALGEHLAHLLTGTTSEAGFVLPVTPPRPVPFRRLAGLGPHAWLPISTLRDAYEARLS